VIVGAVLTALGGLLARALDEQRRYLRYLRLALGAEPEGVLIDRGQGRALAFALEAARVSVLWDRGRKGLVYRLEQLMGAELIADHVVLARVYRDEPGKRLDEIPRSADQIVLRLIFDNPRDPEFELELWPARRGSGHAYPAPAEAAQAGRRWLASLEAILRKPAPRTLTKPAPLVPLLPDEDEPPPWEEEKE
jgi:hypothetical protein